ncbi:hypothetical protein ONZ45_g18617 [Pleurotus djamor]|nr:hypothetical protein ONZ45_g18617 [Pleurotus djamor]
METLSPTSSISSTLLAECMEGHNSLLDETLSLDTLSDTLSISPVLSAMPFPKAPLVKALPPKMSGKPTIDATALTIRESPVVVVSEPPQDDMFPVSPKGIPLTPAGLCIQDWASSLATVEPPGHIPWAGAEGLSHDFNGRGHGSSETGLLRGSDFEMNENFHLQTTAPLTIRRDRKRRAATNTKGELVFEREITLHASADNGRTERWSLQIPATTMNPELDSTYGGQTSGSGYSNVPTPTLVLSDSYSAVPLDLSRPSSEASLNVINLPPSSLRNNPAASGTPPITIAARRGRKTLAPLDLPPGRTEEPSGSMDIAYPGPPTAFLGTPSALSPQPVAINASGTTHGSGGLDIQSMIQNLRIQCAAFPATPTTPVEMIVQQQMPHVAPPVTPPKAPSIKGSSPPVGDSETLLQSSSTRDEWAFTQGLVSDAIAPADVAPKDSSDVYVSQNLAKSTASFRALRNSQSSKCRLEPRADRRTVAPKSGGRASLSQAPVAPADDAAQRQKMRRRTMAIVGTDRLGGWSSPVTTAEPTSIIAPETPTSAHPTLALDSPVRPKHQSQISTMSNSQPPRSILRNRKSVRFASLPNRRSNSSDYPANRTVDGPGTDHGQESKSARRRRLTNDKGSSSLYQEAGPGSDTIKTTWNATHSTPLGPQSAFESRYPNWEQTKT